MYLWLDSSPSPAKVGDQFADSDELKFCFGIPKSLLTLRAQIKRRGVTGITHGHIKPFGML